MLQRLSLKGELKIGQHKIVPCDVALEVDIVEDDEWAPIDQTYNPDNYIDGVRVSGEFYFDTTPLDWRSKHPINGIIQLQEKVADIQAEIEEKESLVETLSTEQERLITLIPNVHQEQADVFKREISEAESKIKKLKGEELPALRKSEREGQKDIQTAVKKLKTKWSEEDAQQEAQPAKE